MFQHATDSVRKNHRVDTFNFCANGVQIRNGLEHLSSKPDIFRRGGKNVTSCFVLIYLN